jgi:hypothetical protein
MREFQSVTTPSRGGAAAISWHSLGEHVDGAARDLCIDNGQTLTAKGEAEPPQQSSQPPKALPNPSCLVLFAVGRPRVHARRPRPQTVPDANSHVWFQT